MIAPALVAPLEPSGRPIRPGLTARVGGLALVVAAVFGAVVWVVGFSPLGFEQLGRGAARSLRFDSVGTYVVVEEVTTETAVQPITESLVVQGPGSRVIIPVTPTASGTYLRRSLPLVEVWELGRISVDVPGTYTIYPVRSNLTVATGGELAVAGARSLGWAGSWLGLVAFAGLPLLAGVAVLVVARPRDREGQSGSLAA